MKKIFLLVFIGCVSYIQAQTTISNAGFEEWESGQPKNWYCLNDFVSNTVTQVTSDVKEGVSAVRLESKTIDLSSMGMPVFITSFLATAKFINNAPKWGFPFSDRPTAVTFWYKYTPTANDKGNFHFSLEKWNPVSKQSETVGQANFEISEAVSSWRQVRLDLVYNNELIPDTCIIDITSSRSGLSRGSEGTGAAQPGSVLYVDGIELVRESTPPPILPSTSTPNGGFENWTTVTYSNPANYPFTVNNDGIEKGVFPLTKVAGYHGNYGVQIKSTVEAGMGFFVNTKPASPNPSTWRGGIPYAQKPTGIRGYYKYNVTSGDYGVVYAVFLKNGTNIGIYPTQLSGLHDNYTLFDVDFSPALTQTPDSVVIAVLSSNPQNPKTGSTLVIDSITFKGVASQPALMNGDFEEWVDNSMDFANSWYAGNQDPQAVKKTTDAYKGMYAVELKTYLEEENGQPKAQAAQFMTGYNPDCPTGNCNPLGGYPFTNQSDALEFYYKYAPVGNDVATVNLYFKDKMNPMNNGWYAYHELPVSSTYQYVEVPFNLTFTPDSVIIQFQSSKNTLSMANIGSTLKIDEVVFRSQKTTKLNNIFTKEITVFPNPTDKGFYLPKDLIIENITITDLKGVKVLTVKNVNNYIDVSSLQRGMYIVQLYATDGIYKTKLIKK